MSSSNSRLSKPLWGRKPKRPTNEMYVRMAETCKTIAGIDGMLAEVDRDVFDIEEIKRHWVTQWDGDEIVSYWYLEAPADQHTFICPTLSRRNVQVENGVTYDRKAVSCWMRHKDAQGAGPAAILWLKYMTYERDGVDAKWQYVLLPKGTFAQVDSGVEPTASLAPEEAIESVNETFKRIKAKSEEPVTFFHVEQRPCKKVYEALRDAGLVRFRDGDKAA
jgi:hypothetical protein